MFVAVLLCLVFATAVAEAKQDANYTKEKGGVLFDENITISAVSVERVGNSMRISSVEHTETSILLKEEDVKAILGSDNLLRVMHYNDAGENDWNRTVITN